MRNVIALALTALFGGSLVLLLVTLDLGWTPPIAGGEGEALAIQADDGIAGGGDGDHQWRATRDATVRVASGATQPAERVELADASQVTDRLILEGTIEFELPAAAAGAAIILNIEPLAIFSAGREHRRSVARGEMRTGEYAGILEWSAGEVLPGRYAVEVEPFQHREVVEVWAQTDGPVRIVIAELAEVRISAIDRASRMPVMLSSLAWQAKLPRGVNRQPFRSAFLDETTGSFNFLAAGGEITVVYSCDGVRRQYETLELLSGPNEFCLEVTVQPVIRVSLLDGNTLIAIHHPGAVDARAADGSGQKSVAILSAGMADIYVTGPGRYQVTVTAIPGLAEIAPQEIDVPARGMVELAIPVARGP